MKKQFESFTEFAIEIDRREAAKIDLVVPSNKMIMIDRNIMIVKGSSGSTKDYKDNWNITEVAHGQISEKLGIPKKYYDRMLEIPGLREHNVNSWLGSSNKNYMARMLDGNMRALVSDRYKPMDNYLVLQSFLPVLNEQGEFKINSSNLSETKMYLEIIFPNMQANVDVGNTVQWGIILSNSEVGYGAVNIETLKYTLQCTNGMIGSSVLRRHHVGSRIGVSEEDYNLYADDTIQADMHSFQLKMRDVLKDACSEVSFQKEIDLMKEAAGIEVKKPETVVKNVTKFFNMKDDLSELILGNMVTSKEFTKLGVANGVTALAHSMEDSDKMYEVQKIGNKIITLDASQWELMSA